jgi:putative transcriptional regulator
LYIVISGRIYEGRIDQGVRMNEQMVEELAGAIQEMVAVHRGERKAARITRMTRMDVAAIRRRMGMTQQRFAAMMRVPLGTLRNWEQGRRQPDGPSALLMLIAALYPEVVTQVARSMLVVETDKILKPTVVEPAAVVTVDRVLDPDDPILSEEAMKARLKNGKRGRPAKRLQV